jgi:hypothetical protein
LLWQSILNEVRLGNAALAQTQCRTQLKDAMSLRKFIASFNCA